MKTQKPGDGFPIFIDDMALAFAVGAKRSVIPATVFVFSGPRTLIARIGKCDLAAVVDFKNDFAGVILGENGWHNAP